MKRNTILAGLLVSTVASEAVHTPLDAHPHIECDVKVSQPSTVAAPISIGGGTAKVDDETLGHFRWRMFHRKMLRANRATWADKDELAMFDAYLETARAVVDHYPSLKLWERPVSYTHLAHSCRQPGYQGPEYHRPELGRPLVEGSRDVYKRQPPGAAPSSSSVHRPWRFQAALPPETLPCERSQASKPRAADISTLPQP